MQIYIWKQRKGFFSSIFLEMKNCKKMMWLIIGAESKSEEWIENSIRWSDHVKDLSNLISCEKRIVFFLDNKSSCRKSKSSPFVKMTHHPVPSLLLNHHVYKFRVSWKLSTTVQTGPIVWVSQFEKLYRIMI